MKLLVALFFGLSTPALAETFIFNQANQVLSLDQKEFETIYRTDQVPDTCYRDEIQGTRTECHTEYDRQCDTRFEQQCYFRNYPVCQNIPRNVCHTDNQCTTQMDQVCNSSGCRTIPRRVCNPVQRCNTQMDQVCHNQQRYECQTVPRQYCQDIPRQACMQVPNIVKVSYACTRPVQVPIGQQIKLHTVAQVSIQLENFSETGQTTDQLSASLNGGIVTLGALNQASNAYLYQVVKQDRTEQVISSTEKQVNYQFRVKAISIQKLNAFLETQINQSKLYFDRLEFNTFSSLDAPFKGSLMILQRRHVISDKMIINQDFGPSAIVGRNGVQSIAFNAFGVNSLKSAKYSVELTLKLDQEKLKQGLINTEALSRIANKVVVTSFEATPAN